MTRIGCCKVPHPTRRLSLPRRSRLAKVWAVLVRHRTEVLPDDIQDLAPYILGHRIWLGPHAASHGLTVDLVIQDILERITIP